MSPVEKLSAEAARFDRSRCGDMSSMALDTRRPPYPLLFAVMGIVVGIGFAVATYQYWQRDQGLREHGRETTATVVEVSGKGKGRKVVVEFQADGRQVRSKVEGRMEATGRVGQTFPVRYDERRPGNGVYDARIGTQGRLVYFLGGLSLIALIGVPLIARFGVPQRRRDL
jgi:hypothetical protein